MSCIAIGAGHCPPDYGAVSQGYFEFKEVVRIAIYVADMLRERRCSVVEFYGSLRAKVRGVNLLMPDVAVEIHLNAAHNENAHGCEVLHFENSRRAIRLAQSIQDELVRDVELADRDIKSDRHLKRYLYFLRKTRCPAVIVEPLFITNANDRTLLRLNGHTILAKEIADGIEKYLKARSS